MTSNPRAALVPALVAFLLGLACLPARSMSLQWTSHSYGTTPLSGMPGDSNFFYNFPTIIARDAANDVFVVGHSTDAALKAWVVTKYSGATGAVLWSKTYATTMDTFATAVAVDASGNAVVTGYGQGSGVDTDILTRKYQGSDGTLLWSASFDGGRFDYGRSIAIDASGDVLVGGDSETLSPVMPGWKIIKYSGATGTELWNNHYRSGNGDYLRKIVLSAAGDVVAGGYTCATSGACADFRVQKFSGSTGAAVWGRTIGDGSVADTVSDLALDASGNVFVAGYTLVSGGSWRVVKIDTSAEPVTTVAWNVVRHYGDIYVDSPYVVRMAPDGHPVVTGRAYNGTTQWAVKTIKFDAANGNDLWVDTYTGPDFYSEEPHGLAIDAAGDVFLGGYTNGATAAFARKLAGATGVAIWSEVEAGTGFFYGTVVDGAGDVILSGRKGSGPYQFLTVKYSSAGVRLWEAAAPTGLGQARAGAGTVERSKQAMAVDAGGNAYVAGYASTASGTSDWVVAKLTSAGTVAWKVSFDAASGEDRAAAVVLDPVSGHPVVAGFSTNASANRDYRVIKFDSASGAVLWNVAHDGGGNDEATALAIDASGHAHVTGKVTGPSDTDAFTRKLNGADGATLWSATYNAGGNDTPVGIVLDAAGNPVVAMQSEGAIDLDFRAVKYSGAAGTQSWAAGYDYGGADTVQAIAIDAAGNVALAGTSLASSNDIRVTKLNGSTGASLWSTPIDAGGADEGYDVAFDAAGDAYVTGKSFTAANGSEDIRTARLGGASGAIVWNVAWHRGIVYSVTSTDNGFAIRINAVGNAVVAGRSGTISGNYDLQVIELEGSDGTLAYQHALAGAGGSDDWGVALALASGPSIRVAGMGAEFLGLPGVLVASLTDPATTTTAITSHLPDPSAEGQSYAVSVTVSSLAGVPAGSVVVDDGNGNTCNIAALDGAGAGSCALASTSMGTKTLTATFTPASSSYTGSSGTASHSVVVGYLLTTSVAGTGVGTITSSPSGIDCPGDCSEPFVPGTMVTLTPAPNAGSTFAGWSGGGCAGTGTCQVTMNSPNSVTATFNPAPSVAPRSGFNGDARSDVLWRDSTGGLVYQWQMNGFALSGQGYMPSVPSNWIVAAIGDANGDGRADVMWREAGGLNYLWLMNGLALSGQGYLPTVPNPWIVIGMGDANGDTRADVFWRNPTTGQNYLWILNGLAITSQGYLPSVAGTDWEARGVADYNGDGRADVLWRNKATGQNYLWIVNGLVVSSQAYLPSVLPVDWEIVGSPDANGDGKADVLWRHKITGQNYLWLMNGLAVASQGYLPSVADANWKVVGYGDYNGDGRGDVLWRHATSGQNYLWTLNGIGVASQGYLPSVGGANWAPVK